MFAVIRSRPSRAAESSEAVEEVSSEHLPLPELALRLHFAELSLDEELELLRRQSPQLAEWLDLLAADKAEEALSRAEAEHDTNPRSRVAARFLMRAHLSVGDNAGAAKVAQAYFKAVGASDCHAVLQAWHHLRAMNVLPGPETAKEVLGVVVEANLSGKNGPGIPTTLVATRDGWSMLHRGRLMVPATPDTRPEVEAAAKALVEEAAKVELPAPSARRSKRVRKGFKLRFTFLTPGGPSVLEADIRELSDNAFLPLSMPFLRATELVSMKSRAS
ncbi:hypothetical protein LY474_11410 [Myxococcus stipitatus]|uniref:hypothetical protein n=1 Tax=Myxococcus stipitatus TaxID=83455 RepID=UPI001F21554F|nr:hypothetical protein [Myxococcus stipitatus]MCE9668421.1 hypothetical protein [Myxococcus stipitatus]